MTANSLQTPSCCAILQLVLEVCYMLLQHLTFCEKLLGWKWHGSGSKYDDWVYVAQEILVYLF